ncbi:MAG: class I SAM-dependent methyltransferase [Chloroflexi bacterium]|nr:class I SAM-dependent methyltransferase [Chloroflexota bacterium]
MDNTKSHWEQVYATKGSNEVSWYQTQPQKSLELIQGTGITHDAQIIDIGGGASTLVDFLLQADFQNVTVLDISAASLHNAQQRLGNAAKRVTWLETDITQATLATDFYDVWHDRAVFHFLTNPADRLAYVQLAKQALKPNGHIIVATFAPDGPTRCSGLDVVRYDPEHLHGEFGEPFELVASYHELHQTPFGTEQSFIYCYCKKRS